LEISIRQEARIDQGDALRARSIKIDSPGRAGRQPMQLRF